MKGRLSIARVTHIGLRLLDVLMAAHRVGILHCDVKPANVHLCDDGRVVLTDFGIACSMLDEGQRPHADVGRQPSLHSARAASWRQPRTGVRHVLTGCNLVRCGGGQTAIQRELAVRHTVIAVVEGEPAPCLHAGPLRAVIEGLLAKNPADRLTGDQARTALVDLQQRLRPGAVTEVVEGGVDA